MQPNSFRTGIAIISVIFLMAGTTAALAQGADAARGARFEHMLTALKGKLALNTSQQLVWDNAFAQSLAARDSARTGRARLRDLMHVELAKTEPDLARIAVLADDVRANTLAVRRQARDEWLKLYATFTPDQKLVIRDLAKKRMERFARFAGHGRERSERGLGRLF